MELNYEMVIDDASLLRQKTGEAFSFPVFFAPTNENIRWRLHLYPNGDAAETKDFFGFFIQTLPLKRISLLRPNTSLLSTKMGVKCFHNQVPNKWLNSAKLAVLLVDGTSRCLLTRSKLSVVNQISLRFAFSWFTRQKETGLQLLPGKYDLLSFKTKLNNPYFPLQWCQSHGFRQQTRASCRRN